MNNTYNYRYTNIADVIEAVEKLEEKKSRLNKKIKISKLKNEKWNLNLNISDEKSGEERIFTTEVSSHDGGE